MEVEMVAPIQKNRRLPLLPRIQERKRKADEEKR
jgi:hypothetical protein